MVKPSTGATQTYTPSLSDYSGSKTLSITLSDLETETYNVTATLKDKLNSTDATATTGVTAFSLYAGGKGAAFFKKAEAEGLNVGGDTAIDGDLSVAGNIITPTITTPAISGDTAISGNTNITGDLTVTGTISGGGTAEYLPLSGGTITGDLTVNGNLFLNDKTILMASGSLTGGSSTWYISTPNMNASIYKTWLIAIRAYVYGGSNLYTTFVLPPIADVWSLLVPYGGSDYFRIVATIALNSKNESSMTLQVDSSRYSTVCYIYAMM